MTKSWGLALLGDDVAVVVPVGLRVHAHGGEQVRGYPLRSTVRGSGSFAPGYGRPAWHTGACCVDESEVLLIARNYTHRRSIFSASSLNFCPISIICSLCLGAHCERSCKASTCR